MKALNQEIVGKFYQKSLLLQQKGEKYKYRAWSYVQAAKAIEKLDQGLDEIYQKSWLVGLQKIKGIGNRLAHEIENELKKRMK